MPLQVTPSPSFVVALVHYLIAGLALPFLAVMVLPSTGVLPLIYSLNEPLLVGLLAALVMAVVIFVAVFLSGLVLGRLFRISTPERVARLTAIFHIILCAGFLIFLSVFALRIQQNTTLLMQTALINAVISTISLYIATRLFIRKNI